MTDNTSKTNRYTKYLLSGVAVALAAIHIFIPSVKIDEIALALVFLAMLPWLMDFLQTHIKRAKFFGQEIEFHELERRVEEQGKQIAETQTKVDGVQDRINTIVTYFLSFYLFKHLSKLYHGGEYRFHKDNLEKDLRLLRDLGYLEYFKISDLQDNDNLSDKIKLTPLGRLFVELRESKEQSNKTKTD